MRTGENTYTTYKTEESTYLRNEKNQLEPNLIKNYCQANSIGFEADLNEIDGAGIFEKLLSVRSEVLGDEYKLIVPFLIRLASGRYDTLSLAKYYSYRLKLDKQTLITRAFPNFEKELLDLQSSRLILTLLSDAIAHLFEKEEATRHKQALMEAFGYEPENLEGADTNGN